MTDGSRIRVFSVDDHPLLRDGICAIINSQPDMSLAGAASSCEEAFEVFRELRRDVSLLDLQLPKLGGIDVMLAIRAEFPDARFVVLTTFARDFEVHRAVKAGACGYLLKNMPAKEMIDTIRQVHAGKKRFPAEVTEGLVQHVGDDPLSVREVEVLRHVAAGSRNRDIAESLFIAEETVKAHLKRHPHGPNYAPRIARSRWRSLPAAESFSFNPEFEALKSESDHENGLTAIGLEQS